MLGLVNNTDSTLDYWNLVLLYKFLIVTLNIQIGIVLLYAMRNRLVTV